MSADGAAPSQPKPAAPHRHAVWRLGARVLALVFTLAFVGLLVYGILSRAANTSIDDHLAQGQPVAAPRVQLPVLAQGRLPSALSGLRAPLAQRRLSLAQLRGTPLVLNFWASWCDPCRAEAPVLERGWRALGSRGVLFLGLDSQDVSDDARSFLKDLRVQYPSLRDVSNATARRWGVTGLPETFFIDTGGRVVGHVTGVVSPRQLARGAAAAQRGQPQGRQQGGARRKAP